MAYASDRRAYLGFTHANFLKSSSTGFLSTEIGRLRMVQTPSSQLSQAHSLSINPGAYDFAVIIQYP